jgi:DNA-binding GntR family transcriptional regulator
VYDLLTEKLLSGEFKPGQILTLRSLAADFSVSIIPVREALSLLEAEGVILRRSNRDYRIRELSYDEYNDIMDLRAIMESKAAVFACKNAQAADYAG